MRTLYEIVEDVKNNKRPNYEELRYALLVLDFMLNMDHSHLREELLSEKRSHKVIREMKAQSLFDMYKGAMNMPPKEFIGWNNDPENPNYQKRRELGDTILDMFMSKETGD